MTFVTKGFEPIYYFELQGKAKQEKPIMLEIKSKSNPKTKTKLRISKIQDVFKDIEIDKKKEIFGKILKRKDFNEIRFDDIKKQVKGSFLQFKPAFVGLRYPGLQQKRKGAD